MAEKIAATPFEDITAGLNDLAATGNQIIAGHPAAAERPFGTELLRDTDETHLKLGDLACVRSLNTQVDDSPQTAELYTGFEPVAEAAVHYDQARSLI